MRWVVLTVVIVLLAGCGDSVDSPSSVVTNGTGDGIDLPPPDLTGETPLEASLRNRRSIRDYSPQPLAMEEISQLLWATQGVTSDAGQRTAPSAGGLYPLELYLVTANGSYHYDPRHHRLEVMGADDRRASLSEAALSQEAVADAAGVFVIAAVFARTEAKYGRRAERYVHLEAGHAAQNLLLQAVALELGAVPIGAFHDDAVQDVLEIPEDHAPLYLIPVGHPVGGDFSGPLRDVADEHAYPGRTPLASPASGHDTGIRGIEPNTLFTLLPAVGRRLGLVASGWHSCWLPIAKEGFRIKTRQAAARHVCKRRAFVMFRRASLR